MIHLIFALLSMIFHWQSFGSGSAAGSLESAQWKHRVLAYVVASDTQRDEIERTLESENAELVDRDLLLVNLGEIELETRHSLEMGPEEKKLWREFWDLGLSESRFILIGKDGGTKATQRDNLELEPFFNLIDLMPMRRAELRARDDSSQLK
ncbi:DUF4174 domain-containing protein [Pelagicoccus sp. SDUM812002]|uniref:DUF4174 domain-containing protein n=1 Tax=Pelagicoccus sp. SDUM812002 TaxID=3041266 RepID=UPI00280E681E|nr:DUF4174 domain-containing protein [Pelagicoccus sp. SDUM812002]MDQ8187025.1 DUF4174 domain-containing protein [Pelagicoccus sp. SDUM812002]